MKHPNILPALFLSLPLAACVTDVGDEADEATEEPDLSTTTQALTGTSISYHECDQPYGLPCQVDLGSTANNRACFLGGIYGHLGDGGGVQIYNNLSGSYRMILYPPSG